jgi:uncharacterized membrane protein
MRAGALAAGLVAPVGFEPSLMPRTPAQQGLVSGLSASATLGAVALGQSLTTALARRIGPALGADPGERVVRAAADAALLGAGLALQRILRQRPEEPMRRAIGRTAGYELALGSAAALTTSGFAALAARGDRRTHLVVPALLTVGASAAAAPLLRERARTRFAGAPDLVPSLASAAAVSAGVQAATIAEQRVSRAVGTGLAAVLPGPPALWAWAGRASAAGASAALVVRALDRVYERIESGAQRDEPGLGQAPDDPFVSGGSVSMVPFASLSREGRRHVLTRTRAQFIERVMGELARAEPVRVYVGLGSAPTIEQRVALALDEVERLGALDRGLLLLVSPTGTGYVNYAAVEAVEYLSLGDVATVTMQYSLRPSFLSLDEVDVGREQNRALWTALRDRIAALPPDRRPRVLMFGESLGAHTSQDAVLHRGTAGLAGLGVERALWIGTPLGSGWAREIRSSSATARDRALVGEFDSFDDLLALPERQRAALRYVMITHTEDGVPKFGPPLSVQAPGWLIGGARAQGIPPTMRWAPFTTFLQVFVDMLNGSDVTPGTFAALGHDYRADLLDFASAVYALPASDDQVQRLRQALPRYEKDLFDFIDGMKQAGADTAVGAGEE